MGAIRKIGMGTFVLTLVVSWFLMVRWIQYCVDAGACSSAEANEVRAITHFGKTVPQ